MTASPTKNQVVVITGAAGGIGAATARRFGQAGAKLALLDRDREALEAFATKLQTEGCEALALACDVSQEADCQRAIADAHDRFGRIDILINNAGITHLSHFANTDVAVLRRVMDVNVFGAVHCTQAALPWLRESRGCIVVLSSVAGFAPLVGRCGYSASKHALHGLFESMRGEVEGDGIHVMMVCPSFTRTKIGEHALGAHGQPAEAARTEYGTPADPATVADAIYNGVVRRKRMLVLSPVGKLSYLVSRILPATYERMMVKRLMIDEAG